MAESFLKWEDTKPRPVFLRGDFCFFSTSQCKYASFCFYKNNHARSQDFTEDGEVKYKTRISLCITGESLEANFCNFSEKTVFLYHHLGDILHV